MLPSFSFHSWKSLNNQEKKTQKVAQHTFCFNKIESSYFRLDQKFYKLFQKISFNWLGKTLQFYVLWSKSVNTILKEFELLEKEINYLPVFPTPGAPITATLTSDRDDFFLFITLEFIFLFTGSRSNKTACGHSPKLNFLGKTTRSITLIKINVSTPGKTLYNASISGLKLLSENTVPFIQKSIYNYPTGWLQKSFDASLTGGKNKFRSTQYVSICYFSESKKSNLHVQ